MDIGPEIVGGAAVALVVLRAIWLVYYRAYKKSHSPKIREGMIQTAYTILEHKENNKSE